LSKTRRQDSFALTSFAEEDTLKAAFTDSVGKVSESVRSLAFEGKRTLLYQALHNALKRVREDNQRARRIFVVISDARDEGSEVPLEQVIAEFKAALVPIYFVYRGQTGPAYRPFVELLVGAAGGEHFFTRNEQEVAAAFDRIYDLETRSLIVGFTYPTGKAYRTSANARIKLRRQDGTLLTAKVPVNIPLPDWTSL
jgi:von Willebrand factor type A domain